MPEVRRRREAVRQRARSIDRLEIERIRAQGFGENFEGVFLGRWSRSTSELDGYADRWPAERRRRLIAMTSPRLRKVGHIHGQFAWRREPPGF